MSDSSSTAATLSPPEQAALVESAATPAGWCDRDDLRLFAGAFVAGFLFFLTWLG